MPPARTFQNSVQIDLDNDGKLQVKCHPEFAKELGKFTREVADLARKIVRTEHFITGRLGSSIQPYKGRAAPVRREGPHRLAANITAGSTRAPYARWVHEGNKPHEIWARKGSALSFRGAGKNGSKSYTFSRLRVMDDDQAFRAAVGATDAEFDRLASARDRRRRGLAGRRIRSSQADVYREQVTQNYAERNVVVPMVNHPGYAGHRFLNEAAVVVARRYNLGGGQVNLPKAFRGPFR